MTTLGETILLITEELARMSSERKEREAQEKEEQQRTFLRRGEGSVTATHLPYSHRAFLGGLMPI